MSGSKSISQRLISGSASAAIGKLITAASALGINAILARVLTPAEMGAYFLVMSIVFIGALLSQLGAHQAIVRLIAGSYGVNEFDTSRQSIKSAYIIVFSGALLTGLVYIGVLGQWLGVGVFESELVASVAAITALWIVLRAFQTLISQTFRGFHHIFYATVFEGALTGVLVIIGLCVIFLLWRTSTLQEVIILTLFSLLVTIVAGLFLLQGFYKDTAPLEGCDIKGTLKISLPLFLATAAVPCIGEAHIWILGAVSTEDEVAVYGAAFRVAKFVIIPLLVINSVIPPMIAQLMAQGKKKEVERILRATATVAGVPSIIIVAILGLFAANLMGFLFGEFYEKGSMMLLVLILAQAINSLTGSPGVLLMMSGHQGIVMKFALLSGAIGVLCSLLLVSKLGGLGVSIGVAAGMVSHNLGMWMYSKTKLSINTHMGLRGFIDIIKIMRNKESA